MTISERWFSPYVLFNSEASMLYLLIAFTWFAVFIGIVKSDKS